MQLKRRQGSSAKIQLWHRDLTMDSDSDSVDSREGE